jgi:hypothetical protein
VRPFQKYESSGGVVCAVCLSRLVGMRTDESRFRRRERRARSSSAEQRAGLHQPLRPLADDALQTPLPRTGQLPGRTGQRSDGKGVRLTTVRAQEELGAHQLSAGSAQDYERRGKEVSQTHKHMIFPFCYQILFNVQLGWLCKMTN